MEPRRYAVSYPLSIRAVKQKYMLSPQLNHSSWVDLKQVFNSLTNKKYIMCLETFHPEIKIAEKAIVVYKYLRNDNSSEQNNFRYDRGTVCPEVELNPRTRDHLVPKYFTVDEGYHSYKY